MLGSRDFCVGDPGVAVFAVVFFGGDPAFCHFGR